MQRLVRRGWAGLIALTCAGLALCCAGFGGTLCAQAPAKAAALVPVKAAMPAVAPIGGKIFPLADVRRGLQGVAYTVFEGVTPEPMEVEILGVLKDAIGPGQDMILGRLKGEKPEYTGVVAGMSGSPVYVDGRLLGALSYRIGQFSKEPICGITPIEQMFEVRDEEKSGGLRVAQAGEAGSSAALRNDKQGDGQQQGRNAGVPPLRSAPVGMTDFGGDRAPVGMTDLGGDRGAGGMTDFGGDRGAVGMTDFGGNRGAGGMTNFGGDRGSGGMAASAGQAVSGGGGEVQPIETALVFGGFSQEAVERFGGEFRALGMTPVAGLGGAAAAGTKQPEPLVPGSAVSAVLVRGDLSISGTCTVTYVDPTRLLACGHPITQYGPVSIPMTKAEVVATLASPLNAFKIINTTETVGSFTEDRASAIMGRFGVDARMIPVSVDVVGADPAHIDDPTDGDEAAMRGAHGANGNEGGVERVSEQMQGPKLGVPAPGLKGGMHFEVLDNRELTPAAMLVSVYQSLSGTNGAAAQMSYRMSGELTLKGLPPVRMQGIMSPSETSSGAIAAALYVNDRFSRLYSNAVEQPEVTGLHLRMEAIPERRTAVLEGARLERTEVHAGDTLEVEATLHPYQAEARVVRMAVKLPDSLSPGALRVVVSDGATVDRLATSPLAGLGGAGQHALALADEVAQINRMHENDRIYVTLLDHTAQAELDAQALPEVPLSMANVLEPLKAAQKMQLTGESMVEAGSVGTAYAVSGAQVLTLNVR